MWRLQTETDRKSPETTYVNCFYSLDTMCCQSSVYTRLTCTTESKADRFVVKVICEVTNVTSLNLWSNEPENSLLTCLFCHMLFLHVTAHHWSSVSWTSWPTVKPSPVYITNYIGSLFVFLIPLASLPTLTQFKAFSIPFYWSDWVGRKMKARLAVIHSILRLPWLILPAQTRQWHWSDRMKKDPD